ncbi:alpha/beta hydrolase [Pseudoalteromonas denitrificans]|uniref:Poly(3-hydroxybutyrate) depolymerase n=1 Tax=Pseudoalteromonas denitrificans DSM 6059 TaxID=1123010 RepID=A0A1I1UZZ1_9GAMM|nr:alpha/beta hydrolase [Pseudoalteromonas denitrificans]SFD76367.1 Poly(3-hydroxybutyrate) depolymerase [Pseudoalteromonas denitrificans DSM 6059]
MTKINTQLVKTLLSLAVCSLMACNSNINDKPENLDKIAEQVAGFDKYKHSIGDREYYLVKPNNYNANKAYKLLLAFHGSKGTASEMRNMAKFEQYDDNYLIVYPQSKVEEWNEGCDCNKPNRLGIDDLDFVNQIIDDVKLNYHILDDEIYSTGFSQGALFTQNLLCNSSEKFKAVASVAAPMSVQLSEVCNISEPTDYLLIHGTKDNVLPYKGQKHSNWGLISSPDATSLIAQLNQINTEPSVNNLTDNLVLTEYKNETHRTQLLTAQNAGHSWFVNNLDTSKYILKFFQQSSNIKLPKNSFMIKTPSGFNHVRAMGLNNDGPAIVLISGFNKNFHSDSAWYALLQPLLAENYRVYSIDRAGNAWGDYNDQASYRYFVDDLHTVLKSLNEDEISLVSFASSNITAQLFQDKYASDIKINNMVWIDPDILLPHSIALYKGYPVDWYEEFIIDILPYVEEDYFTERSTEKVAAETLEIKDMIAEDLQDKMDWDFYHTITSQRLTITGQKIRATEIANYPTDLDTVSNIALNLDIPITVIDSDFEQADINNADQEDKANLIKWQQEGSQWSKDIAEQTGGQYIELTNSKHLVPFENPEVIKQAIAHLLAQ